MYISRYFIRLRTPQMWSISRKINLMYYAFWKHLEIICFKQNIEKSANFLTGFHFKMKMRRESQRINFRLSKAHINCSKLAWPKLNHHYHSRNLCRNDFISYRPSSLHIRVGIHAVCKTKERSKTMLRNISFDIAQNFLNMYLWINVFYLLYIALCF